MRITVWDFPLNFSMGKPCEKEPSKSEIDSKLILIGELWYSPRVFTEQQQELCDDAKAFKRKQNAV